MLNKLMYQVDDEFPTGRVSYEQEFFLFQDKQYFEMDEERHFLEE